MDPTHALAASRTWPPDDDLELELDARLAAHEANPTDVRTSEQVRERFRRRGQLRHLTTVSDSGRIE